LAAAAALAILKRSLKIVAEAQFPRPSVDSRVFLSILQLCDSTEAR